MSGILQKMVIQSQKIILMVVEREYGGYVLRAILIILQLIIEQGKDYVLALSVYGTTGQPLGFKGISDTNIAWVNIADVNVGGFPLNPQSKSPTTVRFCCRLF